MELRNSMELSRKPKLLFLWLSLPAATYVLHLYLFTQDPRNILYFLPTLQGGDFRVRAAPPTCKLSELKENWPAHSPLRQTLPVTQVLVRSHSFIGSVRPYFLPLLPYKGGDQPEPASDSLRSSVYGHCVKAYSNRLPDVSEP